MRLFELVDGDEQVLAIIKPMLVRAKAEGAESVSTTQLLNDLDSEDNIDAQLLIDILHRHRRDLKDLITNATIDSIVLNKGASTTMTSKFDQDLAKMKNTAVQQAKAGLK